MPTDLTTEHKRQVGERIAALRLARRETQEDLAQAVGVSPGTPSRWERGVVLPSAADMLAIAQHYSVSVDHLFLGGGGDQLVSLPAFAEFLDTFEGRLAAQRGLVRAIAAAATQLPYPPTLVLYRQLALAFIAHRPAAATDTE